MRHEKRPSHSSTAPIKRQFISNRFSLLLLLAIVTSNPCFMLCKFPDPPDIWIHLLKFKHSFFFIWSHISLTVTFDLCAPKKKKQTTPYIFDFLLYKRRKLFGFHWWIWILRKISHLQSQNEIARRELILISAIISFFLKSLSLSIFLLLSFYLPSVFFLTFFLHLSHALLEYAKDEIERERKKPTT